MTCKNCLAIEETKFRQGTRLYRHEIVIRRREGSSELWMHMVEADQQFSFSETNIIAQGRNDGIQIMNEAWLSERFTAIVG